MLLSLEDDMNEKERLFHLFQKSVYHLLCMLSQYNIISEDDNVKEHQSR
jgi:hypothetical protein